MGEGDRHDVEKRPWKGWTIVVYAILLLLAGGGILILILLDEYGKAWAWPLVTMIFGAVLFLIGRQFAKAMLNVLELLFPIIGKLLNDARRRDECDALVKNMERVFQDFRLFERLEPEYREEKQTKDGECVFKASARKMLADDLFRAGETSDAIVRLSKALVAWMTKPVTARTLTLLYQGYHNLPTREEFQQAKREEQTMKDLAAVLEEGGCLPDPVALSEKDRLSGRQNLLEQGFPPNTLYVFPYKNDDVVRILMAMDDFSIHQVKEWMRKLEKLWDIVRGYLAFLIENQAAPESMTIEVGHVLDLVGARKTHLGESDLLERLANRETVIPSLLSQCWLETVETAKAASAGEEGGIKEVFGNLDDRTLNNLGLISQILYFLEKRRDCRDLKEQACAQAAKDPNAVRMVMAYLEYRENLREQTTLDDLPFVSLKYLAQNWSETIAKRESELGAGFQKELNILKETLQEGAWPTRLWEVLNKLYEKLDKDLKKDKERLEEKSRRRPGIGEALKRVFLNLKLETIERFLEARTITAYLLTFDSRQGSLADLIDCLCSPRCRPQLEKNGIRLEVDGRPKYVFEDYTAHSRIGVTPPGISFEAFYQMIEEDLIKVNNYRQRENLPNSFINRFEIILHRFGLSGRDRYHFDSFLADRQVEDARKKIRLLLTESLSPSEMMNVIAYQQEKVTLAEFLKEMIKTGQIIDFVFSEPLKLTLEQSKALADNDRNLKDDLLRRMRQPDLLALAQAIAQDERQRGRAEACLSTLLGALPAFRNQNAVELCNQIAQTYFDTFADIISMY